MQFETGELVISMADLGGVIIPADIERKATEEIRKLYPGRRVLVTSFNLGIMPGDAVSVVFSIWRLDTYANRENET